MPRPPKKQEVGGPGGAIDREAFTRVRDSVCLAFPFFSLRSLFRRTPQSVMPGHHRTAKPAYPVPQYMMRLASTQFSCHLNNGRRIDGPRQQHSASNSEPGRALRKCKQVAGSTQTLQ